MHFSATLFSSLTSFQDRKYIIMLICLQSLCFSTFLYPEGKPQPPHHIARIPWVFEISSWHKNFRIPEWGLPCQVIGRKRLRTTHVGPRDSVSCLCCCFHSCCSFHSCCYGWPENSLSIRTSVSSSVKPPKWTWSFLSTLPALTHCHSVLRKDGEQALGLAQTTSACAGEGWTQLILFFHLPTIEAKSRKGKKNK